MPLYEYECFVCRHRFDRLQKVSADPVTQCPSCGGAVRRLLGVPALQFKGTGFYITDYGKGGVKPGGEDTPTAAASSDSEKPTTSTAAKPASTTANDTKASG